MFHQLFSTHSYLNFLLSSLHRRLLIRRGRGSLVMSKSAREDRSWQLHHSGEKCDFSPWLVGVSTSIENWTNLYILIWWLFRIEYSLQEIPGEKRLWELLQEIVLSARNGHFGASRSEEWVSERMGEGERFNEASSASLHFARSLASLCPLLT